MNDQLGRITACIPGVADTTESDAEGVADAAAESDDTDTEAELMLGESVDTADPPEDALAELAAEVTTDEATPSVAEGVATEEAEGIP